MENAGIMQHFPMGEPREKQVKAIEFIERAVAKGYRYVVVEAPTGCGKSAIGVTAGLWSPKSGLLGSTGAYYLVTQKLLQDQLESDFEKYRGDASRACASLKSSVEYPCEKYSNCQVNAGARGDRKCPAPKVGQCPYKNAYNRFVAGRVSVTNYPYFFTERTYVQQFEARQVLVLDECHNIERQILGFIELEVAEESLEEWAPLLRPVPRMDTLHEFTRWLDELYRPAIEERLEMKAEQAEVNPTAANTKELNDLTRQRERTVACIASFQTEPDNWVYWQEPTDHGLSCIAKPINAGPYTRDLLFDSADLKLFMSAYIGPKAVFCRSLGLTEEQVAWASLGSTFPVANRPIHLNYAGSMGRKSIDRTFPLLCAKVDQILSAHGGERGLIHVHSYQIGRQLYNHLMRGPHAQRILFPVQASHRNQLLYRHIHGDEPTVLISPSMTEGFSFDDDLARWQIIAKCPFASLGDRQVLAKKQRDPEWYTLQTVSTFLQAAGRIVRCVDTDTEILTTQGWKKHNEVHEGDVVYGADPRAFQNSGRPLRWNRVPLVRHHVLSVNKFGKQPTVRIHTHTTDQVITPDHRVVFQPLVQNRYLIEHRKDYGNYTYEETHLVRSTALAIAKPNELPSRFKLPLAGYISSRAQLRKSKLSKDWFWLVGFIIGDGFIHSSKNLIVVVQSEKDGKKRQYAKLESVVRRLGLDFIKERKPVEGTPFAIKGKKPYTRTADVTHWNFSGYSSARIRDVFLNGRRRRYSAKKSYRKKSHLGPDGRVDGWKTPDKAIPRWCFERASAQQLKSLFDGLIDSDGSRKKRSGTFYSKCERLIDAAQELAVLIGFRTTIRTRSGQFELDFCEKGTVNVLKSDIKPAGTAEVWCPSTELGTFIARRNGSTFLTGNSETDFGVTYVLDSDFDMLYDRNRHFFPKWFTNAFNWH